MYMGIAVLVFLIIMLVLQLASYAMMLVADKRNSVKLYKIINICAYVTVIGMIAAFVLMVVFAILMFI